MITARRASVGVALALAAARIFSQTPAPDAPPFPFAEVRPGIKGTGYTVLSGTEISTFSAEVLGTASQGVAQPRMIVCRLSGAGLEKSGVLAAMSGSPVYVDGKLLGAVAYGWPFAKEPLCGVTPAEDMMAVAARASVQTFPPAPPTTLDAFLGRLGRPGAGAPAADSLSGSGSGLMGKLLSQGFEWTLASPRPTRAESPPPADQRPPGPGEMVGVQLVSGDVQFTAFGTVSWVHGKDFLAFGHPFMGLGSVELPAVGATVAASIASVQRGFKLASPTVPVGVVTEDRPSGVFGKMGGRARMLDVETTFSCPGVARKPFRFQVIRHRQLTPLLTAGALTTLWGSQEDMSAARTLYIKDVVLQPEGRPRVRLRDQAFSGPQAFLSAADYLASALDLLANNPYEPITLDALHMNVEVMPGNHSGTLESAWLDRDTVVPGDPLRLTVRVQPFQEEARTLSLDLPTADLPPGEVTFWVGGSFNVLKKMPATAHDLPDSGATVLKYLSDIPDDGSLSVVAVSTSPGTLLQNRRVGGLPPSVDSLLRGKSLAAAAPAPTSRFLFRKSLQGSGLVDGLLELTVTVKERGDEGR